MLPCMQESRLEREKANEHANWLDRMSSDRAQHFRMAPAYDYVHQGFCSFWKNEHQNLVNESCRHHATSCKGPEAVSRMVVRVVPINA